VRGDVRPDEAEGGAALHAFVSAGGSKGSAAVCSFSVPKPLAHRKTHATETVTFDGQKVSTRSRRP